MLAPLVTFLKNLKPAFSNKFILIYNVLLNNHLLSYILCRDYLYVVILITTEIISFFLVNCVLPLHIHICLYFFLSVTKILQSCNSLQLNVHSLFFATFH